MSIRHHPADELLLSHAAGRLPTAAAMMLASHVEVCARCGARMRMLQAVGGALLEESPPAAMRADAWEQTLAAIEVPLIPQATSQPALGFPPLPQGATWPRAMAGCTATRWRWIGPGMYFSRVSVPHDAAANVFLLRIAAGKYLPRHSHSAREFTQVLYGCFHDGRAQFAAGDFDAADEGVHHQPVVQAGSECICIASVEGRVLFEGFLARKFGALVGM